jgi:hypothetical protein
MRARLQRYGEATGQVCRFTLEARSLEKARHPLLSRHRKNHSDKDAKDMHLQLEGLRFSAKGAAFINSLGQRPRASFNPQPPALKALFIRKPICQFAPRRHNESRFQSCFVVRLNSWGDAPGWNESALTALRRGNRTGLLFHFGDTLTMEASAWLISGQYDL